MSAASVSLHCSRIFGCNKRYSAQIFRIAATSSLGGVSKVNCHVIPAGAKRNAGIS
ncbi:hypothetical protein GF337_16450 [candidate division KSB1 bacterium]|nr:hypothetical protein [candidate division KSB1 bacterium]